jgi:hypothetical protein
MAAGYCELPLLAFDASEHFEKFREIVIPVPEGSSQADFNLGRPSSVLGGGYSFRYTFSDDDLPARNRFVVWYVTAPPDCAVPLY